MIAADTSAWIDFFEGTENVSSESVQSALSEGTLVMPQPVLFELLSAPGLSEAVRELLLRVPNLSLIPGFWERAGELRRSVLKKGFKARSMDCLIAQACIDHHVALIASDQDYRHFAKAGLALVT